MEKLLLEQYRRLAYEAHHNISFDPQRRGDNIINSYSKELSEDLLNLRNAAAPAEDPGLVQSVLDRYQQRYERHFSAWLSSLSNTASAAIVGPSNFPTEMMKKRRTWADNKYDFFREWRTRALKAIEKRMRPPVDELAEARNKLEALRKEQEMMISINKVIRKGDEDMTGQLAALGLNPEEVTKVLTPDVMGDIGFASYRLKNNNAEIRRMQGRVEALAAKKARAASGNAVVEGDGVKLVENYDIDRVQLIYPSEPPAEIKQELHKSRFIWSRKNKAWQRKLTRNGIDAAKHILGKGFKR